MPFDLLAIWCYIMNKMVKNTFLSIWRDTVFHVSTRTATRVRNQAMHWPGNWPTTITTKTTQHMVNDKLIKSLCVFAHQINVIASDYNHLPPACWSTFWKSTFKQQLGCRFDIMDSISSFFLYFDICNCICLDTSYHFSALSLHLK